MSLDAETNLVTSLSVTDGSAYDGHQLGELVRQDQAHGVAAEVYAGDRAYDDGEEDNLKHLLIQRSHHRT